MTSMEWLKPNEVQQLIIALHTLIREGMANEACAYEKKNNNRREHKVMVNQKQKLKQMVIEKQSN